MAYQRQIRIIIIRPLMMTSKWPIKGGMHLSQEVAILKLLKTHLSGKKRVKRAPYPSCLRPKYLQLSVLATVWAQLLPNLATNNKYS